MKISSIVLTATMIAGGCTAAMAQGGGSASPDTTARPGMTQGADQNPTGPGAKPSAGNPDGAPGAAQRPMTTAPVAGTPAPSGTSQQPATRDMGPQNPSAKSDSGTSGGSDGGKK
jgi:hypothetical protein